MSLFPVIIATRTVFTIWRISSVESVFQQYTNFPNIKRYNTFIDTILFDKDINGNGNDNHNYLCILSIRFGVKYTSPIRTNI